MSRWLQDAGAKASGIWRIVKGNPIGTLGPPLMLLGLVLGLGVWGVSQSAKSYEDTEKIRATSLAQDTSAYYQRELLAASMAPVILMSAMVGFNPNYPDVSRLFLGLAPTLLQQLPDNSSIILELQPNGIVSSVYPAQGGNASQWGYDLFGTPARDSVVKTVQDRALTLMGPIPFVQGGYGVIIRQPLFIAGVEANETFNHPAPLNPYCGAPCAYNATSKTKFWGFAAALVSINVLASLDARFALLESRGYTYEVLAPDVTTGKLHVVLNNTKSRLPTDSVEVELALPNTVWYLRLHPVDGWAPDWYAGLLAGVILMAVVIALLAFAVLVSRRQHQTLLEAVLPKEIIRELCKEDTTTMEARILQADTPADMLLMLLGELLEGRMPDLRDVVFIRTVLMRNQDVYAPLNLRGHLRGSSLDADVVRALMRQLGNGGDQESASMYGGGITEDPDEDGDGGTADSGCEERADAACSTAADALALVLTAQPYHTVRSYAGELVGGGASLNLDGNLQGNSLNVEMSGGAITGALVAAGTGGDAPEKGRWRGRKSPLMLSSNGRPGLPTGPPQLPMPVTVPSCVIEDAEKMLALVDHWTFDTWALQEATQGHALSALGFFLMQRAGLVKRFKIKPVVLARLLRAIESGYVENPYHNAVHAADVLQTLHVIVHSAQLHVHYLDPLGLLAAYYAAIVHDYAHPGLTGDFLIATSDPLAIRYNDRSPLENHHCAASFSLLQRPELDVLAPLCQADRTSFRKQVIELVLATDMKQHFSILSHFNTVHRLTSYSQQQAAAALQPSHSLARAVSLRPNGGGGAVDRTVMLPPSPRQPQFAAPHPVDDTERLLSLQIAIKCADIGHLGEDLDVHKRWLSSLEEEFFRQGDKEKELGIPISPLFDRTKQGVSKSQVGFYDFVALPLVHALSGAFPGTQPLLKCNLDNYNHWRQVEGQPPVEAPRSRLAGYGSGRQLAAAVSSRLLLITSPTTPRGPGNAAPAQLEKGRPPPLAVPAPLADGALPTVQLTLATKGRG